MKSVDQFLSIDIGTQSLKILSSKGTYSFQNIDSLETALKQGLKEIYIKDGFVSQTCILSLPPDVLKARVVSVSHRRNISPETVINNQERAEILRKAFNRVKTEISKQIGILEKDLLFIRFSILELKINGYNVDKVLGYQGEELEFRILAVFLIKNFWDIIKRNIPLEIIKIVHLSEMLPEKDGIFLDIGGKITQIFLIRQGKLELIDEFEGGGENFTDILQEKLGIGKKQARFLKEKYSKNLLSIGSAKRIKEFFSKETADWFKELKKKLSVTGIFPSRVILFGRGALLPEFKEIIEKGNWDSFNFVSSPKVEKVNNQYLCLLKNQKK